MTDRAAQRVRPLHRARVPLGAAARFLCAARGRRSARRARVRAVRRERHPRRGRAAHRSRNGLLAICRSRSAIASTTRRPRRRSRRCSPPDSFGTSGSKSRTACWSSSSRSVRRSARSTSSGNKEFETDTLKKALKDIGLAEARIFDRSALDRAEQEMKRQYITRGKYAAQVTTTVTPQERNRVSVNFTIDEGDRPRSRASTSSATRRSPSRSCWAR